jgi:serine protease Do
MIAQINGLPAGTLIIDEIDSESSLSGKGVRQYDMIIAVNGKELTSADILLELIDDGKVGDKLTLTIARINKDYSVSKFDVEVSLVEDKSVPEQVEQTEFYVDPFGDEGYDFFFGN